MALGLLLLVVGVRLGARWYGGQRAARVAFPVVSGRFELPGLGAPIEILRSRRGVPHIEARGTDRPGAELDAWFGLGFVHAQDRLAQMLWLRRLARGRTAEVVGDRGLPADRLARTLGIGRLAEEQVSRLDPEVARVLGAYARGINARIARIEAGLVGPPLGLQDWPTAPEPWTPADSLALVKLVSWSTGGRLENGLVLSDLIQRLGGLGARPFFPVPGDVQGVGVSLELPASDSEDGSSPVLAAAGSGPLGRGGPRSAARDRALGAAFLGSSAWGLSGDVTARGAPILAVDSQLTSEAPLPL